MFVLYYHDIRDDGDGYWDDLGTTIIGPFATREEAEAFRQRPDLWRPGGTEVSSFSIEEVILPSSFEPRPVSDKPPPIFPND